MTTIDARVAELAKKYLPLAIEFLKEVVRIPADSYEKDAYSGTSNHEKPRLDYCMAMIRKHKCVENDEDVFYDDFGDLCWIVQDKDDGIPAAKKRVVYFDGHSDTVYPLREQWHEVIGGGIDCYNGLTDITKVNEEALRKSVNWLVPKEEWKHLIFGRGTADQLTGVVSQMIGTKIALELKSEGGLKGVIVRSMATVAEEDNDGGACMFVTRKQLPGAAPEQIPDVVIMTEGTGDSTNGSLGIYRGQRGRMQIEVEVIGVSAHGSMPHEGLNPLEYGSYILSEAAEQYARGEGFGEDKFLGKGSRTASIAHLDTPSDCAVPSRFTFRFDRRLTTGENPDDCVASIDGLPAVAKARKAGLTVNVYVPTYDHPTHTGYVPGNKQTYLGWVTPNEHPSISTAVETYKRCITPYVRKDLNAVEGYMRPNPRTSAWIFSTDGVGYPVPKEGSGIDVPAYKNWVVDNDFMYPAMFGIGVGLEQHCHKIGEHIDSRHIEHVCAFMGRFPSLYAEQNPVA